jgi:hypothetical protein
MNFMTDFKYLLTKNLILFFFSKKLFKECLKELRVFLRLILLVDYC